MIRLMKTLKILAIFLATLAQVAANTDAATGIVLPKTAGAWFFTEHKNYEPAGLGCSYTYKPMRGGLGAITCYVYTRGLKDIPTGAESKLIKTEMDEVFSGVTAAWQERKGTVAEIQKPKEYRAVGKGRSLALYGIQRITTADGVQSISISILTGYRGNILKVRCTHPGEDVEVALENMMLFLAAILEANRESMDPAFLRELLGVEQSPAAASIPHPRN